MRWLIGTLIAVVVAQGVALYEIDRRHKSDSVTVVARVLQLEEQLGSNPLLGFSSTFTREQVECSMADEKTAVLLVLGQSNATNIGNSRTFKAVEGVDNFNPNNGRCYRARDPLLGAQGAGSNFAVRLGDVLVKQGAYSRVIIAAVAVGDTSVKQWQPGTPIFDRVLLVADRLKAAGIPASAVLWQQGEGDNPPQAEIYRDGLRSLVAGLRAAGIGAPFIAAQGTICGGPVRETTREGVKLAVDSSLGISLGPDTDTLGQEMRRDGCHFITAAGQQAQADLWAGVITSLISRRMEATADSHPTAR